MTRLWTFQCNSVVAVLESGDRFIPSWDSTPQNCRLGYQWMASRMRAATGFASDTPPVWCWHSCRRFGNGPTVGTASLLLSDWDVEQGMVTMELNAPADAMLMSSYWDWNELLDYVIENESLPENDAEWLAMFDDPLLKHDDDDIQAVIPYIEPDWVVSIRELSIANRDWSDAI